METQFDTWTRMHIIERPSECQEREYVMLTAAARSYKAVLPRDEFVAQAIDRHESECDICLGEAIAEHSGYCRHGAEACVECGMERLNL